MNQSISSEQTMTELTPELITNYLKLHPNFFIEHNDLLLTLQLRHESGKAISLVEHQLNRLRQRNQELQQQLNQLVEAARENDRLFEKTRRLILELLEANSLENIIATLEDSLRHDFKVDKICFMLFTETAVTGRSCKFEEAQIKLGSLLATDNITTGQFRENVLEFLFGNNHNISSSALVPLKCNGHPIGLLALGSQNQQRYQRETGTLFLRQISDILCRIMPRFI